MSSGTGRSVVFLVFDGMTMLDVAGPAEAFAHAGRSGAAYALTYASVSGGPVHTSIGARLAVDCAIGEVDAADTLIVSGWDDVAGSPMPPGLVAAVQELAPRVRRLVSICTGSFVLAAAGLLDGRRATTHWQHAELLARAHPRVTVEADALYVQDGDVYTSAGVSAGIDLALALVERDHGPRVARAVARHLVVFMQRPGGQSQFSTPLAMPVARAGALRAVVDLVAAEPALPHTTAALAAHAGVTPRHLGRLFVDELGITPARYVRRVRLDHAASLLEAGGSVAATAAACGFGSAETLRRAFLTRFGVTPSQYRDRFGA